MPEPRIHVDFNGIQEDGRIFALRRHADTPAAVVPGASVQLWDEDGNTVKGRVVALSERDLAEIEVLEDSWDPGEAPEQSPMGRMIAVRTSVGPDTLLGGLHTLFAGHLAVTYTHSATPGEQVIFILAVVGDPDQESPESYLGVQSVTAAAAPASNH